MNNEDIAAHIKASDQTLGAAFVTLMKSDREFRAQVTPLLKAAVRRANKLEKLTGIPAVGKEVNRRVVSVS